MAPERRWYLTSSELTPVLLEELRRALPHSARGVARPGRRRVRCSQRGDEQVAPGELGLAFAAQAAPGGYPPPWKRHQRHRRGRRVLFDAIAPALANHRGPWRLHAVAAAARRSAGRAGLVERALIEDASKSQPCAVPRAHSRRSDCTLPWQADEALVQVALTTAESGVISIVLPAQRRRLDRALSRFPAGEVRAPRDTRPPSRAYRKLLEAEVHLGHAQASRRARTCVDLGASPGGWTYIALDRGARVTAVDRSDLRSDLMENARLTFVRGDAFAWMPARSAQVDWLLCDLIAFPERSGRAAADTWLSRRLCAAASW